MNQGTSNREGAMQYCSQCGTPNAAENRFFRQCGQPLARWGEGAAAPGAGTSASGQQTAIEVPFPDAADRHLRLSVGACRLTMRPRGGVAWLTGTYDDPTGSLPCRITQDGGLARLAQEPRFAGLSGWGRGVPTFDLALGRAQPYALTIETGASETDLDLGGLPLTRLTLKLGAGKYVPRFREPNPQQMSLLDVDAGAGGLDLAGLANANFAAMTLDGGAAAFTCDFGGQVQRDASVHLTTGLAAVELRLPAATAARIIPESRLGQVEADNGFTPREGGYWTAAALAGGTPVLTIHANVALGSLRLRRA